MLHQAAPQKFAPHQLSLKWQSNPPAHTTPGGRSPWTTQFICGRWRVHQLRRGLLLRLFVEGNLLQTIGIFDDMPTIDRFVKRFEQLEDRNEVYTGTRKKRGHSTLTLWEAVDHIRDELGISIPD